jgi:Cu-Zn family superoxide dismutase
MAVRVIAVALIGWFGTALFAANEPVTATLKDGTGKDVGTAKISDIPGGSGVKMVLNLKGLPPGEHALHIHTTGKCEGPAFTSEVFDLKPTSEHLRDSVEFQAWRIFLSC